MITITNKEKLCGITKMKPTPRSMLVKQLRSLGVTDGAVLMVHSSMRSVGPVEGGAEGMLSALLEAIHPGGTLLMVLSADEDEPFDALRTRVATEDMGILAEIFRTTPGVQVNDHAAARYGAFGPSAAALLRSTNLHDYHGPGSVLERLVSLGGFVLRLGANIDTVTLTHYAEYLAEIPAKRRVRLRYVRANSGSRALMTPMAS
jgi:aminoglycoside N3'-acetyltransferase